MNATISNRIPGSLQDPSVGRYTGYNIHATAGSRTVVNANLVRGACLQYDGHNHEGDKSARTFALPTSGFNWPVAIVDPDNPPHVMDNVNTQEGVTANLRKGGTVKLVTNGRVQAYVQANCTKGATRLTATAGQQYLSAFSAGTVDANNTTLGTGGPVIAIADETVDTSGGAALVWVELVPSPFKT